MTRVNINNFTAWLIFFNLFALTLVLVTMNIGGFQKLWRTANFLKCEILMIGITVFQ